MFFQLCALNVSRENTAYTTTETHIDTQKEHTRTRTHLNIYKNATYVQLRLSRCSQRTSQAMPSARLVRWELSHVSLYRGEIITLWRSD